MGMKFQGTTVKLSVDGVVAMATLGELTGYSFDDGERSEIDMTHSESTKKEYVSGLAEADNVTFDLNYVIGSAGLELALASKASDAPYFWEITYSNAKVQTFQATVKAAPHSGGSDDKLSGSVTIRVDSAVVTA